MMSVVRVISECKEGDVREAFKRVKRHMLILENRIKLLEEHAYDEH